MDASTFRTRPFAVVDEGRVWTEWFQPTFDMQPEAGEPPGFAAEHSVWYVGDLFITWATGPATGVSCTPRHVRRSPIDHWVLSDRREGATTNSHVGRLPGRIPPGGRRVSPDPAHADGKGAAAIRRNLRSPSLGPDKLCREAGTSQSQLYRVLEHVGGVANYIKRCRLRRELCASIGCFEQSGDQQSGRASLLLPRIDLQPGFSGRVWRQPRGCAFGSSFRCSDCAGFSLEIFAEWP